MKRICVWLIFFSVTFLVQSTTSVEDEVKTSLINFVTKLSNSGGDKPAGLLSGWNSSTDPCEDRWKGVTCGAKNRSVRKLFLNSSNLVGELDIGLLCSNSLAASLTVLHLENNSLTGELSSTVSSCERLTHLHLNSNRLSGSLPSSLAALNNLKILDISNNQFSGTFPDLSRVSGLNIFLAQNNEISGEVPRLDFSNLRQFNVSNNLLSGRAPDVHGHFHANSFLGNPSLCGDPTPNKCPASQPEDLVGETKDSSSKNLIIMFSGYIVLGIVVVLIVLFLLYKRNSSSKKMIKLGDDSAKKAEPSKNDEVDDQNSLYSSSTVNIASTMEDKSGLGKSEISAEKSALVVLTSPEVHKGLRFEDLLRAPAEMLGRGRDGSLYKVTPEGGKSLVVKRIKNWAISSYEFKQRMERLDQVKHPNVLPALAFYSSNQEKLLVYEFQQNGSLFKSLHGTNMAQRFDWTSRLGVASSIAEALAFMHHSLRGDQIPHGNVKSSNIFLNNDMDPCIGEYGLIGAARASSDDIPSGSAFEDDVHGFGTVLLELLTGNLAKHNGVDLTDWVHAVVREEWTGEVFDKSLLSECASEERMVRLLQVATKCVNRSPEARPTMNQVVAIINAIKEEEDRSAMAYGP